MKSRSNVQLWDYVRIVLSHGWVVLLSVIAVCAAVWYSGKDKPVLYEAVGQLELRPTVSAGADGNPREARLFLQREFNTLLQLINGNALARQVVHALKKEPDLERALFDGGKANPAAISRMIKADRISRTNLVNLRIRGQDRVAIARLLNLVMEQYREYAESRHSTRAQRARAEMLSKRGQAEKEKQRTWREQKAYEADHPDVTSFEERKRSYNETRRLLDASTTAIEIEILRLKPQVKEARQASTYKQMRALSFVGGAQSVVELEGQLERQRELLAKLTKEGLGAKHQKVKATRGKIKEIGEALRETVEQLRNGKIRDYENKLEALAGLREKSREAADGFKLTSREYRDYEKLQRAHQHSEQAWQEMNTLVEQSWKKFRLKRDTVMIVATADLPTRPISQKKGITYLFAVLFGLIGGIGMALLLEYLDDTVKTEDDIAGRLDLQMLGFIPFIRGEEDRPEARHLVTHSQPKSAVSESFRTIRTKIVFALQQIVQDADRAAAIVVTSSQPREGKTTISSNLAITMAHSGTRVLLIDADLRKPRVHKSFQLNSQLGLTNYLAGASTIDEILSETHVKNLTAITCGPLPPNPYELLGSERMRKLLEELRSRFDLVIFDTPPLIFVPDASVLAGAVDGVIHVISAYVTKRKLVQMGRERVDSIGGRVIGAVLNNVDPSKTDYYYYYYYYPGYYRYYSRYYGPDDEEQAPLQIAEPGVTKSGS